MVVDIFFTVKEVADRFKVGIRSIHSLIASGRLKAINISKGDKPVWKIHETSIFQFIAEENEKQINKKNKPIPKFEDLSDEEKNNLKELIKNNVTINKKECWVWDKCTHNSHYGLIPLKINGEKKLFLTHRLAYFLWNGPIQNLILHKCHNPSCCNPNHLYDGDHKKNSLDLVEKNLGIDHINIPNELLSKIRIKNEFEKIIINKPQLFLKMLLNSKINIEIFYIGKEKFYSVSQDDLLRLKAESF